MGEAIIAAIITGSISLLGIILSHIFATKRIKEDMLIEQAKMQVELSHIKSDLQEHNHYAKLFAETMPVVQEQIKVANHRIDDLERKVG